MGRASVACSLGQGGDGAERPLSLENLRITLSYLEANQDLEANRDRWEDPKRRSHHSGLQNSYAVDYRALKGIYCLDPPRALGMGQ